jgi:hypothetical protein
LPKIHDNLLPAGVATTLAGTGISTYMNNKRKKK